MIVTINYLHGFPFHDHPGGIIEISKCWTTCSITCNNCAWTRSNSPFWDSAPTRLHDVHHVVLPEHHSRPVQIGCTWRTSSSDSSNESAWTRSFYPASDSARIQLHDVHHVVDDLHMLRLVQLVGCVPNTCSSCNHCSRRSTQWPFEDAVVASVGNLERIIPQHDWLWSVELIERTAFTITTCHDFPSGGTQLELHNAMVILICNILIILYCCNY